MGMMQESSVERNHKKWFSVKFLVFLYYVLMIGQGSDLVAILDPRHNPFGALLYICCFIYLLMCVKRVKRICLTSRFALSLFTLIIAWCLLHLLFLDYGFPIMPYGIFIAHIVSGVLILRVYGKEIIPYYVACMLFLSFFSLICWAIEFLGGGGILLASPVLFGNPAGESGKSILFYTIWGQASNHADLLGIYRNAGCAWEPGLFSVMVNIAITFYFIEKKGISFRDWRFWIFLMTLISTFSTTGYVTFLAMMSVFLCCSAKKVYAKLLLSAICCALVVLCWSLPFIGEKVVRGSESRNFSINNGACEWSEGQGRTYTVGRFEGLYLDAFNVVDKPILGYGLRRENSYMYNNVSKYVITANGIIRPLAQYGVVLGFVWFLVFLKSSFHIARVYNFTEWWLFPLVVALSSVSYLVDFSPLMRGLEFFAILKYNSK